MKKAIKAQNIVWPNVNDTVPDKGSAIAWRFNNASPQTVWLLDREGVAKPIYPDADLDYEVRVRVKR